MDVVGCGTFCGPDKTNGDRVWTTATGKRKSAITKNMYALWDTQFLPRPLPRVGGMQVVSGRKTALEPKTWGGSNVSLSSATRKVPCSNHGGAMQVVNGRNTAVAGTKALEGQTLAEACWETPENPVSD